MSLDARPLGRRVCVYNDSARGDADLDCNDPATRHVLWESGSMSMACGLHAKYACLLPGFVMSHPVGGCCGMPGTLWVLKLNICVLDDSGAEPSQFTSEKAAA